MLHSQTKDSPCLMDSPVLAHGKSVFKLTIALKSSNVSRFVAQDAMCRSKFNQPYLIKLNVELVMWLIQQSDSAHWRRRTASNLGFILVNCVTLQYFSISFSGACRTIKAFSVSLDYFSTFHANALQYERVIQKLLCETFINKYFYRDCTHVLKDGAEIIRKF